MLAASPIDSDSDTASDSELPPALHRARQQPQARETARGDQSILAGDSIRDSQPAPANDDQDLDIRLARLAQLSVAPTDGADGVSDAQYASSVRAVRAALVQRAVNHWETLSDMAPLAALVRRFVDAGVAGADQPAPTECAMLLCDLAERVDGCRRFLARNADLAVFLWADDTLEHVPLAKRLLAAVLEHNPDQTLHAPVASVGWLANDLPQHAHAQTIALLAAISGIHGSASAMHTLAAQSDLLRRLVEFSSAGVCIALCLAAAADIVLMRCGRQDMSLVCDSLRILSTVVTNADLRDKLFHEGNVTRILARVFDAASSPSTPVSQQMRMIDLLTGLFETCSMPRACRKLVASSTAGMSAMLAAAWSQRSFSRALRLLALMSRERDLIDAVWASIRVLDTATITPAWRALHVHSGATESLACISSNLFASATQSIESPFESVHKNWAEEKAVVISRLIDTLWPHATGVPTDLSAPAALDGMALILPEMLDALESMSLMLEALAARPNSPLLPQLVARATESDSQRNSLVKTLDAFNAWSVSNPAIHDGIVLLITVATQMEGLAACIASGVRKSDPGFMRSCPAAVRSVAIMFCMRVARQSVHKWIHRLQIQADQLEFAKALRSVRAESGELPSVEHVLQAATPKSPAGSVPSALAKPSPALPVATTQRKRVSFETQDSEYVAETQWGAAPIAAQDDACDNGDEPGTTRPAARDTRSFAGAINTLAPLPAAGDADPAVATDLETRFQRMVADFAHALQLRDDIAAKASESVAIENARLKASLAEHEKQADSAGRTIREMEQQIQALRAQADAKDRERAQLLERFEQLEVEAGDAIAVAEQSKQQVMDAEKQCALIRQQAESESRRLRSRVALEEKRMAVLMHISRVKAAALEARCSEQAKLIEDLESELKAQEKDCEDLVAKLAQTFTTRQKKASSDLATRKLALEQSASKSSMATPDDVPGLDHEDSDGLAAADLGAGARRGRT
ncbi:hypothetical protein HK105_203754 [Polyrhizophydium stewartii]|uniref:Uncharacterized protein n=1 Tax=Polyrhizophydium stewartii TaxID=2732419 RepID=A0ABR4NAS5_9FUNG